MWMIELTKKTRIEESRIGSHSAPMKAMCPPEHASAVDFDDLSVANVRRGPWPRKADARAPLASAHNVERAEQPSLRPLLSSLLGTLDQALSTTFSQLSTLFKNIS